MRRPEGGLVACFVIGAGMVALWAALVVLPGGKNGSTWTQSVTNGLLFALPAVSAFRAGSESVARGRSRRTTGGAARPGSVRQLQAVAAATVVTAVVVMSLAVGADDVSVEAPALAYGCVAMVVSVTYAYRAGLAHGDRPGRCAPPAPGGPGRRP